MDLLGYLGQETRNEKQADKKDARGACRREAEALLLGGLSSSVRQASREVLPYCPMSVACIELVEMRLMNDFVYLRAQ